MGPTIVGELFASIHALADEGMTILIVEQLATKAFTSRAWAPQP